MTRDELNKVRDLTEEIKLREEKLKGLRETQMALSKLGEVLGRGSSSQVEKVALEIVTLERGLDALRERSWEAAQALVEQISRADLTGLEARLLSLRYVACLPISLIRDQLKIGERRYYKVQAAGEKKFLQRAGQGQVKGSCGAV